MKRLILVLMLFYFACGKKGPLKPPPDLSLQKGEKVSSKVAISPPRNLVYEIWEDKGLVILKYEGENCDSFKIYRHIKGKKKTNIPYGVTEKNRFIDETPLLMTPMIYEVSCISNGAESETTAVIEVVFK